MVTYRWNGSLLSNGTATSNDFTFAGIPIELQVFITRTCIARGVIGLAK
jgi:hypothetical protein